MHRVPALLVESLVHRAQLLARRGCEHVRRVRRDEYVVIEKEQLWGRYGAVVSACMRSPRRDEHVVIEEEQLVVPVPVPLQERELDEVGVGACLQRRIQARDRLVHE